MSPSRWEHLEDLFDEARALGRDERSAFVDRTAVSDPDLHAELRSLLTAAEDAGDYLDSLRHELLGTDVEQYLREVTSADAPVDPNIGRTVSHYRIEARIGGGGMGVVYRARDVLLDRDVALKFIVAGISPEPDARARFLHEARAASALDHPNICTVYEIAETDDGEWFMAMPAYDGETLKERIARGPLTEPDALAITEQVTRALAVAHRAGIVHRDVKPANVFITKDGVVKLLDFGLARSGDAAASETGTLRGTVAYMSPEVVNGARADARSDVWAVGVMLFEMLAGVRPFLADTREAVIHLTLTHEPDLPSVKPDVTPGIAALVHASLSKVPSRRFADATQLLAALGRARDESSPPGGLPRRMRTGRRWLGLGVGGAVTIGLAAWLFVLTQRNSGGIGAQHALVSSILWVDDNPENNASIILQLRQHGVQVTTALSTAEGLAQYDPRTHGLVVSDIGRYEGAESEYVGRAGLILLEELRRRHQGAQVAFCTSPRAVAINRDEALAAGAVSIVGDCSAILALVGL